MLNGKKIKINTSIKIGDIDMGMFDEIIIPKSYLKGVLNKKDEKLFDTYHKFQTKDFEPMHGGSLDVYKLSRSQLSKQVKKDKWKKVTVTKDITFYTSFTSKNGDECWFEFEFTFVTGKIDSKKLTDRTVTSKESQEARVMGVLKETVDRMWAIEQKIFEEYREKLSYRFWMKVEKICQKLTALARNKHSIPYELRETAYKISGRLKKDPNSLDNYKDI